MGFNGSVFRVRSALKKLFNSPSIKFNQLSYNVSRVYLVSSFCTHNLPILNGHTFQDIKVQSYISNVTRSFSSKKPTNEEIAEKVMHVCKTFDKIPADKLTLDAHFMNDLGLDSLDHVELIMNMEDDFNFEIPDGDAEKLLRPKDIVEYLAQKDLST